jgi:hypothetical protein
VKRLLIALVTTALLLCSAVPSAFADDWCSDDPPVRIQTPAGRSVVVKVTDFALGTVHQNTLKLVTYSYVATPTLDGKTKVVLIVNIPGDSYSPTFQTRSVVSSAADDNGKVYSVLSNLYGVAGTAIVHTFTLDVA